MNRSQLNKHIAVACRRQPADLVLKNCRIVNVFVHEIQNADIAVCDGIIVGIGAYNGIHEIDAEGRYALPGFIDSHVHVESSLLTPEEFGKVVVPCGTTTTISDPHEIVNVCGMVGLSYMLKAAQKTALDILYMMPSCVPSTEKEHNGARINAELMRKGLHMPGVIGIAEFMNAYGIDQGDPDCIDKLIMAREEGALIDGHSPGLPEDSLAGYIMTGIRTDHECTTIEEMRRRLEQGMYVQLRYGSTAEDLLTLADGVSEGNARRCLLCSDDRKVGTILERGDIDDCLRVCVNHGIDPITAVQMATINAAECYHLDDRGAIAPGRRADIVLAEDLIQFCIHQVFIAGKLTAENGRYLLETKKEDITPVASSCKVKDFSLEKLRLHLNSGRVHVIEMAPGTLISRDRVMDVSLDESGELIFDPEKSVAKVAVIERHQETGNVANALICGYGIQSGAIAVSIGHDSHNIMSVGTNAEDMYAAVSKVIEMNGGIALVKDGCVLEKMELPVAGLMTTLSAEEADARFKKIHDCAINQLGVNEGIEPVVGLCFMALPVIPEIKLTDMGLFHVGKQEFISLEA